MNYLNAAIGCCLFLLFSLPVTAQTTQSFTYQTVIRDAAGSPLTGPMTFRMSILEDGPDGTVAYQETVARTPNEYGLVTINVGEQDPAAFATIDWGATDYFLRTEVDVGEGFAEAGSAELIRSVPYALHARYGEDADADPANELQQLTRTESTVMLSDGGSVSIEDGDADPTNELQQLTRSRTTVTLSDGGSVSIEDGDASPTNELQQLSMSGNTITLSEGGSITLEASADTDPTNELQQLTRSGSTVTLSDGGSVSIEDEDANPANELQQLTRSGTTVTLSDGGSVNIEDNDANPANELQQLTRSGNIVTLSDGGEVNIEDADADPANELQQLTLADNVLSLSDGGSVMLEDDEDLDPLNEIQQLSISGDRIFLSDGDSFVDVQHVWSKVGSYERPRMNFSSELSRRVAPRCKFIRGLLIIAIDPNQHSFQ